MDFSLDHAIITPLEMAQADAAAAASGIPSYDLMIRAGHAVAACALRRFPQARRYVLFCGPGNNGGDGYVAARLLARSGASVVLYAAGDPARLRGDARSARDAFDGPVADIADYRPEAGDVVIDALFGAGLSRDVSDAVAALVDVVDEAALPVLSVDLPSGVCGLTGKVCGAAFRADCTVTFMARKPGHLLLPGRSLCADIEVFDIGIPTRIIRAVAGNLFENGPSLFHSAMPRGEMDSHKYRRGHLTVFSGEASKTGAARLSAMAGLKAGAGLVTLASPAEAMDINAGHLTAIMLKRIDTLDDLRLWIEDARLSAFVLGPGFGISEKLRDFALALADRPLVLDADGISAFRQQPSVLFSAFAGGRPHLVLTPHEGEFGRLFPDIAADDDLGKIEKARMAAARANAIIVYKGADTVIAAPDGRAAINTNAPAWLATAGSGDVLAGMIGALMASGTPAFEAAAAGVYLHGAAARLAGPGMTAEDLAMTAGKAVAAV